MAPSLRVLVCIGLALMVRTGRAQPVVPQPPPPPPPPGPAHPVPMPPPDPGPAESMPPPEPGYDEDPGDFAMDSNNVDDGAGMLGLLWYQNPGDNFRGRYLGGVISGDISRLAHEFLYQRGLIELGFSYDKDNDDPDERKSEADGFRYHLGALGGIGFGFGPGYVALGAGLAVNGDTGHAVPAALTVPVELRVSTYLGSVVRITGWVRGDRFWATYQRRRDQSERFLFADEVITGGRITFITEHKRWTKGKKRGKEALRGLSLGFSRHRTMGSAAWIFQIGIGATSVPGSTQGFL